jgi:hypothetical protein
LELLTLEDLNKLQAQDPYHPSGPGRELSSDELMVVVKFFTPDANWTWYAVSAYRDKEDGDVQFFGFVDGLEAELGYFWLSELKSVRGGLGLPVERDLYWTPKTLAQVMREVRSERVI